MNLKTTVIFTLFLSFTASLSVPASSGLSIVNGKTKLVPLGKKVETEFVKVLAGVKNAEPWKGRWAAPQGATLTIYDDGTLISVTGSDRNTVFQINCLPHNSWETAILDCSGSGRNLDGKKFIYKSQLILEKEQQIKEKWEINGWDTKNAQLIGTSGEDLFQKISGTSDNVR